MVNIYICPSLWTGTCRRNDECMEFECCKRISTFNYECSPLKNEGENCTAGPQSSSYRTVIGVTCPCMPDLECVEIEGSSDESVGECEYSEANTPE